MNIRERVAHVKKRQKLLRETVGYQADFELWEESCVPSYCHPNPLAAYISWARLFAAVKMAFEERGPAKKVLDFGSSIGELGQLIPANIQYDFVESHDPAASFLQRQLPQSRRVELDDAPAATYDRIFAIDSLEHNSHYAELLEKLATKLAANGILILSGPTENKLYRFGRKIAGFDGHYHETNIHAIEAAAARFMTKIAEKTILPVGPLFRVTAWQAMSK